MRRATWMGGMLKTSRVDDDDHELLINERMILVALMER